MLEKTKASTKIALLAALIMVSGCTHGRVSSIPIVAPDGSEIYKYEGRANFAHQDAEAERQIIAYCTGKGAKRPVMVGSDSRNLGVVAIGQGNASAQMIGNSVFVQGNSQRSYINNQNQIIYFKCV